MDKRDCPWKICPPYGCPLCRDRRELERRAISDADAAFDKFRRELHEAFNG